MIDPFDGLSPRDYLRGIRDGNIVPTLEHLQEALRAVLDAPEHDKTAWLIEINDHPSGPEYFRLHHNDWTPDHDAALHFSRRQDAELVIQYYEWTWAKAVEHVSPVTPAIQPHAENKGQDQ